MTIELADHLSEAEPEDIGISINDAVAIKRAVIDLLRETRLTTEPSAYETALDLIAAFQVIDASAAVREERMRQATKTGTSTVGNGAYLAGNTPNLTTPAQ